jgi:hypothetical protein
VLDRFFEEGVALGLAQAAVVTVLALAVMFLARSRGSTSSARPSWRSCAVSSG